MADGRQLDSGLGGRIPDVLVLAHPQRQLALRGDQRDAPNVVALRLMGSAPDAFVMGWCGILPEAVAVAGPGVTARAGVSAGLLPAAASPSMSLDKMSH